MQLFYHPNLQASDTQVNFDKEESRHIQRVLRKKEGDIIYTTNGLGYTFKLSLSLVSPKQCQANVLTVESAPNLPYNLHLAVAPTKNNDRFEWFLEKATEIGISQITPLICQRSERKQIKLERYEKIIVSAIKQSLQSHLPILNPLTSFSDFIVKMAKEPGLHCIAHCEQGNKQPLKNVVLNERDITIVIGPEGDFSFDEIKRAIDNNFIEVSLGEQRLRTETAAIVACHTVHLLKDI
jgi:16S rRNA (uracil1498-N3)-methyltransferase